MSLWLLRHGQAHAQAPRDDLRELTEHGRTQVRLSAEHLQGIELDLVLVSPYLRAQQSADELCTALGYAGPRKVADWLTPESSVSQALTELDAYEGHSLLLVTHQPFVGELVGLLISGSRQLSLPMNTASLARLDGPCIAAGAMSLTDIFHPL